VPKIVGLSAFVTEAALTGRKFRRVSSGVAETNGIVELAVRPFGVLAPILLVLLVSLAASVVVAAITLLDLISASFGSIIVNLFLVYWRLGDGDEKPGEKG
jgi:hypothetical protein